MNGAPPGSAFNSGAYTMPSGNLQGAPPPGPGLHFMPMNNDASKAARAGAPSMRLSIKPASHSSEMTAMTVNHDGPVDDDDLDAQMGSEDGSGGAGAGVGRRKRQREANLQAQRRCRERHRTHVVDLEKEVEELREEAAGGLTLPYLTLPHLTSPYLTSPYQSLPPPFQLLNLSAPTPQGEGDNLRVVVTAVTAVTAVNATAAASN